LLQLLSSPDAQLLICRFSQAVPRTVQENPEIAIRNAQLAADL
jgi:hypothetical protein